MNYQHILNLALKRRATLVKRLDKARSKGDDTKCEELCYLVSIENDNIGFCKQKIEQSQRELAILLCQHNRALA
jgi:hypothetical protein